MAQGRLAGKSAFLTASGQGIGATALAFQREGARVFVGSSMRERIPLRGDFGLRAFACDTKQAGAWVQPLAAIAL